MSAETVTVQLGQRSYPVRIGAGMRQEALAVAERRVASGQKCVAITSPGVAAAQSGFTAQLARLMPVLILPSASVPPVASAASPAGPQSRP